MKCENCGKREANVKYTQNINGKYNQIQLCEECAKNLGLDMFEMNMPIDFSSFLGDMLSEYSGIGLLPNLSINSKLKCEKCGLTYEEFLHTGKLGCMNCYKVFRDKIEPVLKNLHGSSTHVGRKAINIGKANIESSNKGESDMQNINEKNSDMEKTLNNNEVNSISVEISELQKQLKKAIQEERYEDAAEIRDKIKKIEEK